VYELSMESDFAAAHRLTGYQGPCENLHGHNWKVRIVVKGESLDPRGMVMDFREIKDRVNLIVSRLDHRYLNELPPFDRTNPTTENLARHICETLAADLPEPLRVARVEVWESDSASAAYIPGESAGQPT
jgi:6-pyruvoyltetrahydropterin/6-carboxytetrahydropterin synthase